MNQLRRLSLLGALCITSCHGEEEPEVCSAEHITDDVEDPPAAQKSVGASNEDGRAAAAARAQPRAPLVSR